jgi:hypothetical protein
MEFSTAVLIFVCTLLYFLLIEVIKMSKRISYYYSITTLLLVYQMSAINSVTQMKKEEEQDEVTIIHSYRANKNRRTLIFSIPKHVQERYNLNKPTSLYLIPKKDCFVLRKVDLESVK